MRQPGRLRCSCNHGFHQLLTSYLPQTSSSSRRGCRSGSDRNLGMSMATKQDNLAAASEVPVANQGLKVLEEAAGFSLPVNFYGNLVAATTDGQLTDILAEAKAAKRTAVVSYGASWCHACKQMLPTFCNLSNDYPSSLFVYADIDKCERTTQDVRYTPTFRFYRAGTKVDEFYGGGAQNFGILFGSNLNEGKQQVLSCNLSEPRRLQSTIKVERGCSLSSRMLRWSFSLCKLSQYEGQELEHIASVVKNTRRNAVTSHYVHVVHIARLTILTCSIPTFWVP